VTIAGLSNGARAFSTLRVRSQRGPLTRRASKHFSPRGNAARGEPRGRRITYFRTSRRGLGPKAGRRSVSRRCWRATWGGSRGERNFSSRGPAFAHRAAASARTDTGGEQNLFPGNRGFGGRRARATPRRSRPRRSSEAKRATLLEPILHETGFLAEKAGSTPHSAFHRGREHSALTTVLSSISRSPIAEFKRHAQILLRQQLARRLYRRTGGRHGPEQVQEGFAAPAGVDFRSNG